LADVLECLPAGLIVVDESGRIVYCNPMGDAIREVGDRVGEPVESCHPARTHEAVRRVFAELAGQDPQKPHPIVVERRNRWEITYSRITDREGRFRGVAWMAHDITRQKELQRRLLHQERLVGLGRMAARLAHDVKNPLNVISGAVHNLRASCPGGEVAEMLSLIHEQSQRLSALVDRLRELTRPLTPSITPVDAGELVRRAVEAARRCGKNHLQLKLVPPLGTVLVDPQLVERLLANALDNALQATGRGGTVRVRAGLDTQADGEWLVIEVEDDGPGFPPEVLEHLFEPFVTTRPDGTGLGLVIMREICELHGGTLAVENLPGVGARVTARLLSR
jgi:PAS domain S-box-containing protein